MQQGSQTLGFLRPHAGQRLVEEKHLWVTGQCHGDFELALLAVGKGTRQPLGGWGQADALQRGLRLVDQLGASRGEVEQARLAAGLRSQPDVLQHR